MAFVRPTLAEIVDRVQVDFVSRLSLTSAILRRSMIYVLSRVIAGAAHMLHGHLEFLGKQLFPDTSETEYLARQASVFGISRTAATFATGTITFLGTNGKVVPISSTLTRSDGAEYTTNAEVTIAAGTATATVTASLAGSTGTLTASTVLTLVVPISGVTSEASVVASVVDGSDEETDSALRVRLLARISEPPMGGSSADYVAWAKTVAGVTRVWVDPLGAGPGTVVVRFTRDNDAGPIPSAGEVTAVQTVLDTEAPAHATVTAVAPVASALDFTIAVTPNTTVVKAAVLAELTDLLYRDGDPTGCTILKSSIQTAIGNSEGVTNYVLTAPASDTTFAVNYLPTMGTITWV